MSEKILKRFEDLSIISRNELLDIRKKIIEDLESSFKEFGDQVLLEEDKIKWKEIFEALKDIEEANLDMNLIRDIIFKETILKIQKKESNKIQKLD